MAFPVAIRTWTVIPNNLITFNVTLLDTQQNFLYGVKNALVTHGYSVVWSSSNGVGPTNSSDHTDRWTNAAAVTPRATIAAASQAWIVYLDGNGAQLMFAFQGASDDIARISYSPGALFTLAGTTNQQPTATDEQVFLSATSTINATASGNRVWHLWIDSQAKLFRVVVMRSSIVAAPIWGVELFDAAALVSPATISPAVWGFSYAAANLTSAAAALPGAYSANAIGGLARFIVSGTPISATIGGTIEQMNGDANFGNGVQSEAQGSAPMITSLGLCSATAGIRGKVGNRIDWWVTRDTQVCGTTNSTKAFIVLNNSSSTPASGSLLWPWDGTTVPQVA